VPSSLLTTSRTLFWCESFRVRLTEAPTELCTRSARLRTGGYTQNPDSFPSGARWGALPRMDFNEGFALLCPQNARITSLALRNLKDHLAVNPLFFGIIWVLLPYLFVHRNRHECIFNLGPPQSDADVRSLLFHARYRKRKPRIEGSAHQLTGVNWCKQGDCTSMRFPFAFSGLSERNGDLTPSTRLHPCYHCRMFNFGKPRTAGDWLVHIAGAILAIFLIWWMLRMYVL